jgi:hypothetical protein
MTPQEQKTSDFTLGYGVGVGAVALFSLINDGIPNKKMKLIGLASLGIIAYALYLKNKN